MKQLQTSIFKLFIFLNNFKNGMLNLIFLYKNQIRLFNYTFFQILNNNNPDKLTIININIIFYLRKYALTN